MTEGERHGSGANADQARPGEVDTRDAVAFPLPLPPLRPHNLPAHGSSFVGREDEIAEIASMLGDERLVTLVGPGGVGKTRLALEVAESALANYADGVWFVELAELTNGSQVAARVRATLPDVDRAGSAADLPEDVGNRRILLVLDNCENVRDGCATLVHDLLRRCSQVTVLATSRQPLDLPGERVTWVPPLSVPGEGSDLPAGAADDGTAQVAAESVRLFLERARSARPALHLAPDAVEAVAEICRRLDGLPLAIELAAARVAVLSPAEILDQLDDRFRLLADRAPVAVARHRTLRASLEWSHRLLEPAEAALFARLAVFSGGWDLRAARQVCAGRPVAAREVLEVLAALVAKNLVVVDGSGPVTRYRMLETIRCFAVENLVASEELERIGEAHARWCVARAQAAAAQRGGREPDRWLDALEEDHANLRAGLAWARDHGRVDIAMALGVALSWFWETRGHLAEGLEWLTWALETDVGDDVELRARGLRAAGIFSWLQGDVAAAIPLVEESVGLFRDAGNHHEATGCVCASAFHMSAHATQSLPGLEDDLARLREGRDHDRLARALVNCGVAYFFVSDGRRAGDCFRECLDLPREGIDSEVVVDALDGHGRVAVMTGDLRGAEDAFGQALELARSIDYDDGCCTALSWLGEISRIRGDYARARALLSEATQLAEDRRVALWVARCQQFTARLDASEGRLDEARELLAASLEAPGTDRMPYHRIRSLQGLADIALAAGEQDAVRDLTDEAMGLAKSTGDIHGQGQLLATLARLACLEGEISRAAKLAHEALQLQERIGDVVGIVSSLETLAELAAASGRAAVAGRIFGAAQKARETCGCRRPRVEEATLVRNLPNLSALLEEGEWATAVRQGSTLSRAEAVSYATRGRGTKGRPATGWDSLTPVELEVAYHIGSGLSGPEIAERLMVSVKTIATHLSHIYRKLEIRGRRELRSLAREHAPVRDSEPAAAE